MYQNYFKPIFDFLVAAVSLTILSPILLILILILALNNKGKPFFFQQRPGKKERLFTIIKFKTMNDKKDEKGELLPDVKRITKVGKIIRSTSLDELPQLINVIKGDMSFIGPRPLLVEYLPYYNKEQTKRHWVKPGITGWAQVNGRNAISWEEKFGLDVWYVNNISFKTDVRILLKTLEKVYRKDGISASEEVTMPKFRGTQKIES